MPFYPTNNPKNQNVEKKKKILGDIILHNCTKNHARDGCNLCFFLPSCAIFCLFTPQQTKKEKKTSGHIILQMCIKNYDHMMTEGRTVGKSDI